MDIVEAIVKGTFIAAAVAWEGCCSLLQALPDSDFVGQLVQSVIDFVAHCYSRRR